MNVLSLFDGMSCGRIALDRLGIKVDNYTNHVSNTQRYKMLGNGWTIEIITHILKNIKGQVK